EGVLLVGEEAIISAKVTAGTIVCKGKITGDIHAKDKMKLRAPAMINGGVTTPMLSMEDGVFFNGTLEMEQTVHPIQRETVLHPVGPTGDTPLRKVSA
ncbi:MAG: polymer-forming cytoskeletal protein, partial [Nitrospira sp.]|nr:polymer-forming cytoskeletal protein [Nitrospira sp.]